MVIFSSSTSIFLPLWQKDFGWTRGEIFFSANASILVALLAPWAGKFIDRIGVQAAIIIGILLSCSAYIGLASMPGQIWLYYCLYFALSVGGLLTTGITYSNAISRVFVRTRGISLAAVRSGVALGSGVAPIMLFYAIKEYDWRAALIMLALVVLCVGLPTIWFWMRPPPIVKMVAEPTATSRPVRFRVASEPKFFWLAAGTSLNYAPVFVLLSQLHPMLMAKGLNDAVAAGLIGALGIAALLGGWLAGFLIDRIWAPAISASFSAGAAIGCAILLFAAPSSALIFLAIALIGNAYGAENDMAPFLVAKYVGMEKFSSAYGVVYLFFTIAAAVLVWTCGVVFDKTGSYTLPTVISLFCFAGAALCHLALGPYPIGRKGVDGAGSEAVSPGQPAIASK